MNALNMTTEVCDMLIKYQPAALARLAAGQRIEHGTPDDSDIVIEHGTFLYTAATCVDDCYYTGTSLFVETAVERMHEAIEGMYLLDLKNSFEFQNNVGALA